MMTGQDMGNSGVCGSNAVGVGNAADVMMGQAIVHSLPVANVFICRDAGGLYAVDAGCTHLGCDVAPVDPNNISLGFKCPCHQATYDANGQHPTSPAPRPLNHYLLCAQPSGALVVDPTQTVEFTVRLKV